MSDTRSAMAGAQTRSDFPKPPQTPLPVHPFPARMAPELALERLPKEPARVLDQMMGSGTIPVLAGAAGHSATGYDLDPLALLIAEVWGRPLEEEAYLLAAGDVAEHAREAEPAEVPVKDTETLEFIERWFDEVARGRLAALTHAIDEQQDVLQPALWCAFSRLIITKDRGASLARDVSHSRPHKVRERTDFDPIAYYPAIRTRGREATRDPARNATGSQGPGLRTCRRPRTSPRGRLDRHGNDLAALPVGDRLPARTSNESRLDGLHAQRAARAARQRRRRGARPPRRRRSRGADRRDAWQGRPPRERAASFAATSTTFTRS